MLIKFINNKNTTHRVNAYIRNGWDKEIVDPDNQVKPASTVPQLPTPADGWQELSEVYGSADQVFGFTNAQLVTYFVTRMTVFPWVTLSPSTAQQRSCFAVAMYKIFR